MGKDELNRRAERLPEDSDRGDEHDDCDTDIREGVRMIGLRKHEHCKMCGAPIPKGYVGAVSADLEFALHESGADYELYGRSTSFSGALMGRRGLCDKCANEVARAAIRKGIERAHEECYERGYSRKPKLGGMFGTYPVCPFCGLCLVGDKCPKCGREYDVSGFGSPVPTILGKTKGGGKK